MLLCRKKENGWGGRVRGIQRGQRGHKGAVLYESNKGAITLEMEMGRKEGRKGKRE